MGRKPATKGQKKALGKMLKRPTKYVTCPNCGCKCPCKCRPSEQAMAAALEGKQSQNPTRTEIFPAANGAEMSSTQKDGALIADSKEIINPETGEVIDLNSITSITDAWFLLDERLRQLHSFSASLKLAMLPFCNFTESKTCRLRGERVRLKVTQADDSWDSRALWDIASIFPAKLVFSVMKIAGYKIRLREYKKMLNEEGDLEFTRFKTALKAANRGPVGQPKVEVEDDGQEVAQDAGDAQEPSGS